MLSWAYLAAPMNPPKQYKLVSILKPSCVNKAVAMSVFPVEVISNIFYGSG